MAADLHLRTVRVGGYALAVASLEFVLAVGGSRQPVTAAAYLLAVAMGIHLYLRAEVPPSRHAYGNALVGFLLGSAVSWLAGIAVQMWLSNLPVAVAVLRATPSQLWHAIGVGTFLVAGHFALGFGLYVRDRAVR